MHVENIIGDLETVLGVQRKEFIPALNSEPPAKRDRKNTELEPDAQKLLLEIKSLDRLLQRKLEQAKRDNTPPDVGHIYYAKAKIYVQLVNKDYSFENQALECFAEALKLEKDNVLYIMERAKFYAAENRKPEAKADLQHVLGLYQASKIPELRAFLERQSGNTITVMHVENIINDLEKTLDVQRNNINTFFQPARVTNSTDQTSSSLQLNG